MRFIASTFIAIGISFSASAADRTLLSKDEVQALATDHKWEYVRAADQHHIQWDLRKDGSFNWTNANARIGAASGVGTWSINDAGQLCTSIRVGSRGGVQDRCVALFKDGDNLKMAESTDLQGTYGDLRVVP